MEMKNIIAFDTVDTTVAVDAGELNRILFEQVSKWGVEEEAIERWREMYGENKKDPTFLSETGPYKARLVREGLFNIDFYADVVEFLRQAKRNSFGLVTVSKGGLDFVRAVYQKNLPEVVDSGGKEYKTYADFIDGYVSTSDGGFTHKNKTDPDCYKELIKLGMSKGWGILTYISDDIKEVEAAQKAWEALQKEEPEVKRTAIHIPPADHSAKETPYIKAEDGIYITNSLIRAVSLVTTLAGVRSDER